MSSIHHHRGSFSQHSRSVSQYISASDIMELNDNDLLRQVNELKLQVKMLTLENEILERVMLRLEPSLVHGVQQAVEYALKLQSTASLYVGSFVRSQTSRFGLLESMVSPSRIINSPSRVSTRRVESSGKIGGTIIFGTGPKINLLERSELVGAEMELIVNKLEKTRARAARKHALLKAQLEEIGFREIEVEKATASFNKEVIVDGWDKIAQRIPAEAWIRYMNEWVKLSDKEIGKLRLRTSTLNAQYSKLNGQIKVKTELSESLRPVDFEKLKIENIICEETIDKKRKQLIELKELTGEANLNLAIHKKAMMIQNGYLHRVQKEIKKKATQTKNLDAERGIIAVQAELLDVKLTEVRQTRLAYEVPEIIDYVKVKYELAELKHSIKMLENRFHIQQIALKSLNKQLASMFFFE